MGLESRYLLTISATLNTMASSNSRRSKPVSFLIFSSRYTNVFRWTNSFLEVSDTFAVLNEGRLTKPRPTEGLTMDEIGLMMGGAHGMEAAHHVEA